MALQQASGSSGVAPRSTTQVLIIGDGSPYIDLFEKRLLLAEGIRVMGRISALELIRGEVNENSSPDVVVIDPLGVEMLEGDAPDVFDSARSVFPDAHIVILADADVFVSASQRASVAVVSKEAAPSDVAAAIRNLASGTVLYRTEDVMPLVRRLGKRSVGATPVLTRRQLDVLELLARGSYITAIARTLQISEHTVRGHVKDILSRLGCHSQLEAVTLALREGLISSE